MEALRRDPLFVTTTLAVGALVLVAFVLPVSAETIEEITWWADYLLLGLTILAAWRAARREPTTWGRRFWKLLVGSLFLWFVVLLDWQFSWGEQLPLGGEVFADFLFLLYYFGLLLATTTRPHDRREPTTLSPILLTEVAAGAVLAIGLLAYFVILPNRMTPKAYQTYVPSLSLYVLLDLVLVSRLAWWCRTTTPSRWRRTYQALGAAFLFTLLHDIHELLVYAEGKDLETSAWDLVWWVQFLCLIAATLVGTSETTDTEPARGEGAEVMAAVQSGMGPVPSYAFVLPVIHLGGRLSNLLDPALDRPRETLVLVCALVLGILALVHQQLLNRRYRIVSENLHDAQILLQQSRKMEALGRLAGGVAHGFNNLLSVIVGYSEMLMERLSPGDASLDPLQQIRLAAERAATLTRQLATFSRGRLGPDVALDLDRTIGALVPTIERLLGGRVSLSVEPGAAGAWIQADANQFERALLNIVANAGDATPDGGTVKVVTRALVLGENESRTPGLLPPGPYVEVAVTDTGAGMSEEVRSRLFEPFFTTRPEEGHRGLGLPIVYGVVRQASGHIEVDSQPGMGTTVRLYLPRRPAAVETTGGDAPERPPADRPLTVLLAEDERGLCRLIRSTLEAEGFTVLEATDGRAALDLAEQYTGAIDLLVSDVVMPGFGGPELARKVLEGRPETRVLFISGYAPDALGDLRVRGAEPTLLAKPFPMTELVARIRALLPASEPRARGPQSGGAATPREVTM